MSSRTPKQFSGFHWVGWIQSAHGIRGEVFVRLSAGQADWLDSLEQLHLLPKDSQQLKPYEVEAARPHKDGLIVALKGVLTRNDSEAIARSSVYIDESLLTSSDDDSIYLKQIEGFQLLDMSDQELGVITSFATNGVQDLLVVKSKVGKEFLVPFVEAFLRNIDFDKRQVAMELPEGLIDLEE